jgi:hypothetical protein
MSFIFWVVAFGLFIAALTSMTLDVFRRRKENENED